MTVAPKRGAEARLAPKLLCCSKCQINCRTGGFPGGPVVRDWHFHLGGKSPVPGQGTKVLQALCVIRKKKKRSHKGGS